MMCFFVWAGTAAAQVKVLEEVGQPDGLAYLLSATHPLHCEAAVSSCLLGSHPSAREAEELPFLQAIPRTSMKSDDSEKVSGFGFSVFVRYYSLYCCSYFADPLCLRGRNSVQPSLR